MDRLASLATTHPRRLLAAAAVFVAVCAAFVPSTFDALSPAGFRDGDSPSERTADTLRDAAGFETDPGIVLLASAPQGVSLAEPAAQRQLADAARALAGDPAVARVASPAQDPRLLAPDGRSTLLAVFFRERDEKPKAEAVDRLEDRVEGAAGPLSLTLGGAGAAFTEINHEVERDLARAELLAVPVLFLLLVVVFRGLVAAALPLLVGIISIVGSILGLRLLNEAVPISIFSINLVSALGLGLAVDYSLFLVSRHREELAGGADPRTALRTTMRTAGRTVAFSALTVAAALMALALFPQRFLYSMGLGGTFVTVFAAITSLTVVPALLVVLGPRIDALRLGRGDEAANRARAARWRRVADLVARRPGATSVVALMLLVLIAVPATRLERNGIDDQVLPPTADVRVVADAVSRDFAPNLDSPVSLAVRATPGEDDEVAALAERLRALPGTSSVTFPQRLGPDLVLLQALPRVDPLSDAGLAYVERVRDLRATVPFGVTGAGAGLLDFRASVDEHLPAALLVAGGATLFVLFLLTGSVVLPVKAVLANGLVLVAAYGMLVLVFQDGRLEGLLDYTSLGAIETATTMLVFALVFGLSTDYAVFLLARIAELRRSGYADRDAIVLATERTGSLITAAAVLFCVAIGALATSSLIFLKQSGIGTAFAVAIDATVVRVLLFPALMHLLGPSAWWSPSPLRRLHGRVGISEA